MKKQGNTHLQAQTEYETQLHYDLPTTESQEKSQQSGERGNIPYWSLRWNLGPTIIMQSFTYNLRYWQIIMHLGVIIGKCLTFEIGVPNLLSEVIHKDRSIDILIPNDTIFLTESSF